MTIGLVGAVHSRFFCTSVFVAALGLFVAGCDLVGEDSTPKPDYVGSWIDPDVRFEGETSDGEFYLVFTEDRMTEWQVSRSGEGRGCRSNGADIIQYKSSSHRMVVAPDSGDARKKVYVEPLGDRLVVSERYIFYALGYSDTLQFTEEKPSSFSSCSDPEE